MKKRRRPSFITASLVITLLALQVLLVARASDFSGQWTVRCWDGRLTIPRLEKVYTNNQIIYSESDSGSLLDNTNYGYQTFVVPNITATNIPATSNKIQYTAGTCFYPRHAVEVRSADDKLKAYFEVCFDCVNIKAYLVESNELRPINLETHKIDFEALANSIANREGICGSFSKPQELVEHLRKYRTTNN